MEYIDKINSLLKSKKYFSDLNIDDFEITNWTFDWIAIRKIANYNAGVGEITFEIGSSYYRINFCKKVY